MDTIRTIYSLMQAGQKRQSALLLLVFTLSALLQVAGVASIAPFVALLDNSGLIHRNKWLSLAYSYGGFRNDTEFLVAFAALVIVMTIVSNVVGGLTIRLSIHTAMNFGSDFQRDMYHGYLRREYAAIARWNTASLTSALLPEVGRFVYMVLIPLMNMASYIIVAITIVILLVAVDPVAALAISILIGTSYYVTYRLSTTRLTYHGQRVNEINDRRFRLMSESLGGIKEVKLLGTESHYESQFRELSLQGVESNSTIALLGELPRFFLEGAAFSALLGIAIYMLLSGDTNESIVAVLSLYVMAGYRLLPVAQNILRCASSIKANASVVQVLEPHIRVGRSIPDNFERPNDAPRLAEGPIELRGVSFAYPGASSDALHDVSIQIPSNSITVLVGSSGAGKSTLADVILGLLAPTKGDLRVNGQSIDHTNARSWQRNLGYVPQNIFLLDASIAEIIAMGSPATLSMERVERAAKLASLDRFIESLPNRYRTVTGERGGMLSGGQRQRIGIARALYHDAHVLIMDEATSALDAITENEILDSLGYLRKEKTIILIAHRLATIQSADWIVMLKDGSVVAQGTYEDLATNSCDFKDMLLAAKNAGNRKMSD